MRLEMEFGRQEDPEKGDEIKLEIAQELIEVLKEKNGKLLDKQKDIQIENKQILEVNMKENYYLNLRLLCSQVALQENYNLSCKLAQATNSHQCYLAELQVASFLGDPAKQEVPQEEMAFVRSYDRHDLSFKAYNSASVRPIALKF